MMNITLKDDMYYHISDLVKSWGGKLKNINSIQQRRLNQQGLENWYNKLPKASSTAQFQSPHRQSVPSARGQVNLNPTKLFLVI